MQNAEMTRFKRATIDVLDVTEDVLYCILAALLIGIALLAVWAAVQALGAALSHGDIVAGVIEVIDKVLLAFMIVEILYTVTLSFRSHALAPAPFLVVALIAAVRRVLLISLEAAHPATIESTKFQNYMIELGVLGLLIAIFVVALWILNKQGHQPGTAGRSRSIAPEEE